MIFIDYKHKYSVNNKQVASPRTVKIQHREIPHMNCIQRSERGSLSKAVNFSDIKHSEDLE